MKRATKLLLHKLFNIITGDCMWQVCVVPQFFYPLEPLPFDCVMLSGCAHKKHCKRKEKYF